MALTTDEKNALVEKIESAEKSITEVKEELKKQFEDTEENPSEDDSEEDSDDEKAE